MAFTISIAGMYAMCEYSHFLAQGVLWLELECFPLVRLQMLVLQLVVLFCEAVEPSGGGTQLTEVYCQVWAFKGYSFGSSLFACSSAVL